jgi:anaerobic selenocysteine-containing dehydrogenase
MADEGRRVNEKRSFCRLCTALCGILVTIEDGRPTKIRGDKDHPLSKGYTCPKGRSLADFHLSPHRLNTPEYGPSAKARKEASWDETLADLAARTRHLVDENGPDAVGAYFGAGGTFDGAGFRIGRKFIYELRTKNVFSSATVDAPCRPYIAELVTGNPLTFGRAIDYSNVGLTILVGLNPLVSHGHNSAFPNPRTRLRQLLAQGDVWVVDPRATETAKFCTHHLVPRPGTDYIWLGAVIRELMSVGYDLDGLRERASGVDEFKAAMQQFTLADASERCGMARDDLQELVNSIRRVGRVAVLAGTGVSMTPSANVTEWLTWALSIVTDSIDVPGGTWCNPGYLRGMEQRKWVATDGEPDAGPPSNPMLPRRLNEYPSAALAGEILSGRLRGLFVLGGNPMAALPDTDRTRAALSQLEFLAVADVVQGDTVQLATHVLPCADHFERADLPIVLDTAYPAVATQYAPAILPLVGDRRPMWWSFAKLGDLLGLHLLPEGLSADACTDDDILRPLADRGRTSFEELKQAENCVVAADAVYGWMRESLLPEGRFRLAPKPLLDQLTTLRDASGLVLLPRRQLRHVNSVMARHGTADRKTDEPCVLLNPRDADELNIADGQPVLVTSPYGELVGVASVVDDIREGAISIPHGFGAPNVNHLTSGEHDLDPLTGMALYSGLAVKVRPLQENQ